MKSEIPVTISFSKKVSPEASSLFHKWAKGLQSSAGTVSHSQAADREAMVVRKVE